MTYLAGLLVYRSIRSFFSLLLFSLKWIIILGVLGFILAYHLGNGDMEKGAHEAVQKTGVANAIRKCESLGKCAAGPGHGSREVVCSI